MHSLNDVEKIFHYENVFGNWKIGELIGEGSFGQVYTLIKNSYNGQKHISAVKIISIPTREELLEAISAVGNDDNDLYNYFEETFNSICTEIKLLEKLSCECKNILTYYDSEILPKQDSFGWNILIRMEYADVFDKYIQNNDLTYEDVIKLGIDICVALETCEKYNIIHCDIKDTNIFVSSSGIFKLGDFGLAKKLSVDGKTFSFKGSPGYMAPEIYYGKKYDKTADIFSLGIVLYKLMNYFRYPFLPEYPKTVIASHTEAAFQKRITGKPLPKPLQACEKFAEIILKACSYHPENRYQSASNLKKDLIELLNSKSKFELSQIIGPKKSEINFIRNLKQQ